MVAIAAALSSWDGDHGVLVLDEPTAVLPPGEVDKLLETVVICARGTSVLYVSHRLDEIFRIADRVTVMRGGRVVETRDVVGLDTQHLAQLMVGRRVDAGYRTDLRPDPTAPVALRAKNLSSRYLDGVDVELRAGEILGVAGSRGQAAPSCPTSWSAPKSTVWVRYSSAPGPGPTSAMPGGSTSRSYRPTAPARASSPR